MTPGYKYFSPVKHKLCDIIQKLIADDKETQKWS